MLDRADQPGAGLGPVQRKGGRLARPAGKDDLPFPAERSLHPLPRIFQQFACLAPFGMRAGGIGPVGKAILHRGPGFGSQRGGGGVVEVDAVRNGTGSK